MIQKFPPRVQHLFFSLVIILILVVLCYFVCLGLGSPELFQSYFWNTLGRALFFSGLRLRLGPAFLLLFFILKILFSLFDPLSDELTKHMNPEDSSSSGAEKGKRPLEISQDDVWQDVDRGRQDNNIRVDSDWTANWVTTRENALGDLINRLRKEEHMRPLAPYRLQYVVESLENRYSIERLDEIIKDIKEKKFDSAFYKEIKIDRDIPKEDTLRKSLR
uniref:Uncharacterized protein n=1 Tax=Solanum aethiopicum TaxID=205524 RepID=M5AL08_SOLAE|nr:hypothetical protein [Solanum melongena]WMB96984.1 hypothetical protein [Solanum melongena]WMB97196.1 hypothetical protein [Solanum aethiopicum]BAN09102.1 hypothetical protein [Solanum aethiopicum]